MFGRSRISSTMYLHDRKPSDLPAKSMPRSSISLAATLSIAGVLLSPARSMAILDSASQFRKTLVLSIVSDKFTAQQSQMK